MPPATKLREAHSAMNEAEGEQVPEAPEPESDSPVAGTETAQAAAARYMPQCVRLFAGVSFGKASRAKLHTRVIAAGHLVKIAGGMADEVPEPDNE